MFDNFIIGQLIARRFSLGPNTTFLRTDASSFLLWRRRLRQRCWQSLADRIREDASNQDPVSTEWSCHRATQEVLPSSLTATQRTSGSGVTSLKSVGAWPEAGLMAQGDGLAIMVVPLARVLCCRIGSDCSVFCVLCSVFCVGQWLGNWSQSIGNPGAISNVHGTVWAAQSTRES